MTKSSAATLSVCLAFPLVAIAHFLLSNRVLSELYAHGETANPEFTLGIAYLWLLGLILGYTLHIVNGIDSMILQIVGVRLFPIGDWTLHLICNSFVWTSIIFAMPVIWRKAVQCVRACSNDENKNHSLQNEVFLAKTSEQHRVSASQNYDELQIRIHGSPELPTLIFLPGIHGDWTLVSSFRAALAGRVRFVEFTYPRTLTWSLDDYANAIESALTDHGIMRGCVLAESFGSQIAWQLVGKNGRNFRADALMLAGGFVCYPTKWNVRFARKIGTSASLKWLKRFLACYARYAKFRHRHAPETLASIAEFLERRTELDRQAIVHRLDLIAANDPRSIAFQLTLPVYSLAGFFDPVVPWWRAQPWLRRNCPGFRNQKVILRADHNVLGTAPRAAAEIVADWISATGTCAVV